MIAARTKPATELSVAIRAATADDVHAITEIEARAFPGDAWSERMIRDTVADSDTRTVVVESEGAVIGYAAVLAAVGAGEGDVLTIAVDERARGRGLGRRLLRELMAIARERRVRKLFLEVREGNDSARALYRSEGYEEIGRRRGYYRPDGEDAITMMLDLRPRSAVSQRLGEEQR